MPEAIHNLVSDAKKNRFSTIPKLSEDDIISVWDSVSEFIELQMCSQKGVHIPNLGTFTFIHKKMDIGNNKFILIQRPVFVLSEKFSQTHALQYTKHHTTGEIPIIQLNFTMLSMETPFDRDTVESCIREVLQALSRAVSSQQNVEFLFRGIGVLSFRDSRVKMKFFKDFLNSMDGSGNLVKVLANELFAGSPMLNSAELLRQFRQRSKTRRKRPGTADSVMSMQESLSGCHRPGTNTLTLPKLQRMKDMLPPISEDATEEPKRVGNETGDADEKQSTPSTRASGREIMRPHPVVGVSLTADELHTAMPAREGVRGSSVKKLTAPHSPPKPPSAPKQENAPVSDTVENADKKGTPRAQSAPITPEPQIRKPSPPSSRVETASVCSNPAHHNRAGQELCYLCMQRSLRNIPVSFEEERRRKEKEQDALLQQYQQMKDQEAILKEQAEKGVARRGNQQVAAFNLGVAEALRDQKGKRTTDFVEEYSKALEEQVRIKKTRETQDRHDKEFLERLEQVQLAEDLAAQREHFLRTKSDQISQYQKALSAQIEVRKKLTSPSGRSGRRHLGIPKPQMLNPFDSKNKNQKKVRSKPLPLPKSEPDSSEPLFGKFDSTNAKLLEQRERARALYKSQLEMVSSKKKEAILQHLEKQKEETEMLKNTRKELIEDRIVSHKRAYEMRHSLEENWRRHTQDKRQRETEERSRMKSPGMLVLQQTEKYNRCGQCERRVHNCGESNIWSESRYIPGSRLMV